MQQAISRGLHGVHHGGDLRVLYAGAVQEAEVRRLIELWRQLVELEDGLAYVLVGFIFYVVGVGLEIFIKVDPFNWVP